jgi:hypothetical protein
MVPFAWLLIPGHCDLTPEERSAVLEGAWKRWARGGVKLWGLGLAFCVAMLGSVALMHWIEQRFGPFGPWYQDAVTAVAMLVTGSVFGAVAFLGYRPGIYAELRALGHDLCPACGRDLRGEPADAPACPHCGGPIPPPTGIDADGEARADGDP